MNTREVLVETQATAECSEKHEVQPASMHGEHLIIFFK